MQLHTGMCVHACGQTHMYGGVQTHVVQMRACRCICFVVPAGQQTCRATGWASSVGKHFSPRIHDPRIHEKGGEVVK
jgi:hypothetical protein